MDEVAIPRSGQQIDLCSRCGGVFLEFFDGEPGYLARRVVRYYPAGADTIEVETDDLTCPDCGTPMTSYHYLDQGPPIGRCDSCFAAFASPAQLRQLASMRFDDEPKDAPSLMQRLRDLFFPERD